MSKTRAALVQQVLDIVNEAGSGQPVAAEDAALVDGIIDPAVAMLRQLGVIAINNTDGFEDEVFLPLATYLTNFIPALIKPDPLDIASARSTLSELRTDDVTNTVRATYY